MNENTAQQNLNVPISQSTMTSQEAIIYCLGHFSEGEHRELVSQVCYDQNFQQHWITYEYGNPRLCSESHSPFSVSVEPYVLFPTTVEAPNVDWNEFN